MGSRPRQARASGNDNVDSLVKEILRTQRLVLRETENADFDDLFSMLSDPIVMVHYPKTYSVEETQRWIDWTRQRYAELGYCLWAVTLAANGEFLGQCGLLVHDIDGVREIEVAYLFKRSAWHRGYATEAARACRDYAFRELGCDHVISLIRPANLPSRAVAERNGMTVWKTTTFRDLEAVVYRVERSAQAANVQTAPTTRE